MPGMQNTVSRPSRGPVLKAVSGLAGVVGTAAIALTSVASADVEPVPAEIQPLAARTLMLDVENIGPRYVAVGERGHVLASKDGQAWVQAKVPTRATLTALDFVDETHGWAVGHDAVILNTTDGGKTWKLQNFDPKAERPLLDVLFLDRDRGFAVGSYGHFYSTTDGGSNWQKEVRGVGIDDPVWDAFQYPGSDDEDAIFDLEDRLLDYTAAHINKLIQLNDGSLLAVGEAGTIAASRDGGASWQLVSSPYEGSYFGAIPRGADGALVFGLRGNAYVVESLFAAAADADPEGDAGADDEGDEGEVGIQALDADWQKVETNTLQSLLGGAVLPNGNAVIVGLNGIILEVAGQRADRVPSAIGTSLANVYAEADKLLLVGEAGAAVVTR